MKEPMMWIARAMMVMAVMGAASLRAVAGAAGRKDFDVRTSRVELESGGKKVAVDLYEPRDDGKSRRAAVILVHGADGLKTSFLDYKDYAKHLASKGYVTLLVHYFERTDTQIGDAATNAKCFGVWTKTLQDAIGHAEGMANVDPKRIGMMGFSLGAYLSVSTAAYDGRVAAVVEYFGGMPALVAATFQKIGPTLILHGDADKLVPVEEAHKLEKVLKDKQQTYEAHIYKGQGHGFTGEDNEDSKRRATEWFDQYLVGEGKKK